AEQIPSSAHLAVAHLWPETLPPVGIPQPMPFDEITPRNCMPSLHTAWATAIFLHTRRGPRLLRHAGTFWLVATLTATLGFGYHYGVDLIAGVVFVLTVEAALRAHDTGWQRTGVHLVAYGTTVLVALLLSYRFLPLEMARHPWLAGPLLVLATASVVYGYVRTTTAWDQPGPAPAPRPAAHPEPARGGRGQASRGGGTPQARGRPPQHAISSPTRRPRRTVPGSFIRPPGSWGGTHPAPALGRPTVPHRPFRQVRPELFRFGTKVPCAPGVRGGSQGVAGGVAGRPCAPGAIGVGVMYELTKGANVGLAALSDSVDSVIVSLGWTSPTGEGDADVSVLLLDENGKVRSDADFYFYNHPVAADGSVQLLGKTPTGNGNKD